MKAPGDIAVAPSERAEDEAGARLQRLLTELSDLAFTLERRGRLDAADVVNAVASRVRGLRDGSDDSDDTGGADDDEFAGEEAHDDW